MRSVLIACMCVALAAGAHLRVDPVQTAGDKGMVAAQQNTSVADVNKKVRRRGDVNDGGQGEERPACVRGGRASIDSGALSRPLSGANLFTGAVFDCGGLQCPPTTKSRQRAGAGGWR